MTPIFVKSATGKLISSLFRLFSLKLIVGGLLILIFFDSLNTQKLRDPFQQLDWQRTIEGPIDTTEEAEIVLEDILEKRQYLKELVDKQKKKKYVVEERIVAIGSSVDETKLLFRKDIFGKKRRGTLIFYDEGLKLMQNYPFKNPMSLVKKQQELLDQYDIIYSRFYEEYGEGYLDHPQLLTKMHLSIKEYSAKNKLPVRKQPQWYQVSMNLKSGRYQILGGIRNIQENLNKSPEIKRMYFMDDGMRVVFVISYETFSYQAGLKKHEMLLPIHLEGQVIDRTNWLHYESDYKLSRFQRSSLYLREEFFDFSLLLVKAKNHYFSGVSKEENFILE